MTSDVRGDRGPAPAAGSRRWWSVTVAAIMLSGLFLALGVFFEETPTLHVKRIDMPAPLLACASDADCVLVNRIACCPCKSGGPRGAINAGQQDALRRFLKTTCRRRGVCVRVNTCQYDLAPACLDGRCVARPAHG